MEYPKTRKEAQLLGAKYYFTGEPCSRGHIAPRKTKGACTICVREDSARSYESRKEYFKEYNESEAGKEAKRRYYEKNKEVVMLKALARPAEDKRRYKNKYKQNNPDLYKELTNARRKRFKAATPSWLQPHHKQEIRDKYRLAQAATKEFGVKYVVDHIIPINGETVCGLHVPWNLQVMRHEDNLAKSNKLLEEDHAAQERNLVQGNRTEHKD
ncbi:hypothetical protein D3C87_990370 [compost metagenome]